MAFSHDFHIHSCLSPCGDDDMTPNNIAGMAAVKGLSIIALTDHNSCKNCPALLSIAPNYGITAIAGIELCTAEEVHVVCLFRTLEGAMDFDSYIHKHIMPAKNRPDIFGKQQIMNENDEIIGEEPLLLIGSTDISFDDVAALTKSHDGIMIPAHIDKSSNSLISNLGFVPPDSSFTCFEVHNTANRERLETANPYLKGCRMLCDSDAHYLWDIHEPDYFIHAKTDHDLPTAGEVIDYLSRYTK